MYVMLGNVAPKEGYYEQVKSNDHDAPSLKALAEERGVSTEGKKEEIAARLSDQVHFRPVELPQGYVGTCTTVNFPEGTSISDAFTTITSGQGVWAYHSEDKPEWVESDSPGLFSLLVEHFELDEKTEWDPTKFYGYPAAGDVPEAGAEEAD